MTYVQIEGPPRVLNIGGGNGKVVFVEYQDRGQAVRDHLIGIGWGALSATVASYLVPRRQSDDAEVKVGQEEFRDAFASVILGESGARERLEALGFSVRIVPAPTVPANVSSDQEGRQ